MAAAADSIRSGSRATIVRLETASRLVKWTRDMKMYLTDNFLLRDNFVREPAVDHSVSKKGSGVESSDALTWTREPFLRKGEQREHYCRMHRAGKDPPGCLAAGGTRTVPV